MKKDFEYYVEELKKYCDNVIVDYECGYVDVNYSDGFFYRDEFNAIEQYLIRIKNEKEKEKRQKEMLAKKAYCACGSELEVVFYKGYYDEFKFLKCSDEDCIYLENQETDKEDKGAYM